MTHRSKNEEMRNGIRTALECYDICTEAVQHCAEKGGPHAAPAHLKALQDCAEICNTAAGFMLRDSEMHSEVCRACAEACERCARSCEQMVDDEFMRQCAEVCRRCAESCRQMAAAPA